MNFLFRTRRTRQASGRLLVLAITACCVVTSTKAESCFSEANPPSCSSEGIEVAEDLNVQDTCFTLDADYVYDSPFDFDFHLEVLSEIEADSELCQQARQAYHLCYWCTPNITSDSYCFFRPEPCHKPPEIVDEKVNITATCEELDAFAERDDWPATIDLCYRAQQATHICPAICQKEEYLGATTLAKRRAYIWMSRVAAFLSFSGACYIMWDVVSNKKNRTTVYHQLLLGMACFDIVTAFAWVFATRPIPEDDGWYVEGAKGNWSTCKAQAFFVQLGITSVLYNVSLSVYYLLVIVYSWRESHLKKLRKFLHGGPLLAGLGLALGGIPVYDWIEYGCHLEPPPEGLLWEMLVFVVIPIGFSILFITVTMLIVYLCVRRQSKVSRKWSLGFGKSSPVEQRVFWQALLYTLSFYVTWPAIFCVYISSVDVTLDSYAFTVFIAFVAPLQGFNNFCVYIRPKIAKTKPLGRLTSIFRTSISLGRHSAAQTTVANESSVVISESFAVDTVDPSVYIAQEQATDASPAAGGVARLPDRDGGFKDETEPRRIAETNPVPVEQTAGPRLEGFKRETIIL